MSKQPATPPEGDYWNPASPHFDPIEAERPRYSKKSVWKSPQMPPHATSPGDDGMTTSQFNRVVWSGKIEVVYIGQYAMFSKGAIFRWLQSQRRDAAPVEDLDTIVRRAVAEALAQAASH